MNSIKAEDWIRYVRPGSRVFIGQGAGTPLALIDGMLQQWQHLGDVEIVSGFPWGPSRWLDDKFQNCLRYNALGARWNLSQPSVEVGERTPLPVHTLPSLFRQKIVPIDVAMVCVSPPDRHGFCSLGTNVGCTLAACASAGIRLAQINPAMPRTFGHAFIHVERFDAVLNKESELPRWDPPKPTACDHRLTESVAQLIADGSTVHLPFWTALGSALAKALGSHRNLALTAAILSEAMQSLIEKGVADHSLNAAQGGRGLFSACLGGADLYKFTHENPHLDFHPVDKVCDPALIACHSQMVTVAEAEQVDLAGQAMLAGNWPGAQTAFIRGATWAAQGRSILALPSTRQLADGSLQTRISVDLPSGYCVDALAEEVHHVVTEYGIATLQGRSLRDRTVEMVQIAHPDFREDLMREARKQGLLPAWFQVPPPFQPAPGDATSKTLHLKDGSYLLRPLNLGDDRRLQEFFYSHSEETIHCRYGFTVTRMGPQRAYELVGVDQNRDLALAIVEVRGPRQIIHAVGRYYLDSSGKSAEVAFVTRETKRRTGMGSALLAEMCRVAKARGLSHLWAQVDIENTAMLKLFHRFEARSVPGEDDQTVRIVIPLTPEALPTQEKPRYSILRRYRRAANS